MEEEEFVTIVSVKREPNYSACPQWDDQRKLDETLAQAQEYAYRALLDVASAENIGEYVGVRLPENGVGGVEAEPPENITAVHLFSSTMRGYQGWQWFVTVSRAPRSDKVTISELGLLPTAGEAIVAPEWAPSAG